jgi:hypothetical protein
MGRFVTSVAAILVVAASALAAPAPSDSSGMPRAAQDEYNLGVAAADQKEWVLAVRHFTAAQASAPDNAKVLYNLGVAHSQLDHVAGAAWLRASLAADPAAGAEKTARIEKEIKRLDAAARLKVEKIFDTAVKVADQYILPPKGEGPELGWMTIPTATPWGVGTPVAPMLQVGEDRKQSESNMKLWMKLDVADCAACVLGPEAALAIDKDVRGDRAADARRDEARPFQHFRQLCEVGDFVGAQELYAAKKARFDARAADLVFNVSVGERMTCADDVLMRFLEQDRGDLRDRSVVGKALEKVLAAKVKEARDRRLTVADWTGLAKKVGDKEGQLNVDDKISAAIKDPRSVTCEDIARLGVGLGQCRLQVRALEHIAAEQDAARPKS